MPIAPAPLSTRLLSRSLASFRCAYSTLTTLAQATPTRRRPQRQNDARRASSKENAPSNSRPRIGQSIQNSTDKKKSDGNGNQKGHGVKMFVPASAKRFINNGKLTTTPDVWAFLQETRIQYDNSKTRSLSLNVEDRHIQKTFSCKIVISDQHILHPYHLVYLQPRGHPFTEGIKSKYKEKLKTQPLWIYFIAVDGQTGLVRTLGQRRLAREFWAALEPQVDPKSSPRGTVIVTIFDSRKAASAPAVQFGKALADAVVAYHKRKIKT